MRLVKFTDLHERDVWVNPDRVDGLYPSGDSATGITASGSEDNLLVRGKPAEVAARLAGESPQVDDPEMVPMSIFQATQQKLAAAEEGRAEVESHLQDAADALTAAEARASVTEQQRDQARAERDNFARRVNSLTDEVDGLRSEILRLSTSAFTNEEQHERDLAALAAERDALKAERDMLLGVERQWVESWRDVHIRLGLDVSGEFEPDAIWNRIDELLLPEPQPEEPAEEAGEEGAGESGQTPGSDDAQSGSGPGPSVPPAPVPSEPEPAPATPPTAPPPVAVPTSAWPAEMPVSTSGLTLTFDNPSDVRILPSVRDRNGAFARGCPAVVYLRDFDVRFRVVKDTRARDGAPRGVFRYRANNPQIWPAPGSWSPDATFLGHRAPPLFPEAIGSLSVAALVGPDGRPAGTYTDAEGNHWVRFDFWADAAQYRTGNYKTHSAAAATDHWLCVPKDWDSVPAPPRREYAFSAPITQGSTVVHGVNFFTNDHGRPWAYGPGVPGLYRDKAARDAAFERMMSIGAWKARFEKALDKPFILGLDPRRAGHRFDGLQNTDQHSYWDLAIPFALIGRCASKHWLREYPLDTHMNIPRIGVGSMEDNAMPARSGKGYDEVEAPIAVAFGVAACEPTFRFESDPEGWTAVEVFRIRDTLARYAYEGLLRNRVDYRLWKTPAGNSYAMWTTALNEAAQVIGATMPDYSSPQYGKAADWVAFAKGETRLGLPVGTGRLGLIEKVPVGPVAKKNVYGKLDPALQNPKGVVWRGGGYDQSHLCLGITAIVDACFGMVGAHEDAWKGWIDKSLPGAQHQLFEPALCNVENQAYYDAVLASGVTVQEIAQAAVKESGDAGNGFAMFRMLKALS